MFLRPRILTAKTPEKGSKQLRSRLMKTDTLEELKPLLRELRSQETPPQVGALEPYPYDMNINMKSMKSRVAERGQVTIPKALRDRLGVLPGTMLEFSEEHGRLVAVKTTSADSVAKVYGCLGRRFKTDAFMVEIRGVRG